MNTRLSLLNYSVLGVLLAISAGWLDPASSQPASPQSLTLDLPPQGVAAASVPQGQALLDIDMTAHKSLRITLELQRPSGCSLHLGNSGRNNGVTDFPEADAEVMMQDGKVRARLCDGQRPAPKIFGTPDIASDDWQNHTLILECGEHWASAFLPWCVPTKLIDEQFFRFGQNAKQPDIGQQDGNHLHLALNRSITGHLSGTGIKSCQIRFVD